MIQNNIIRYFGDKRLELEKEINLGMNKMIVNHLDKLFITSDAATIIKELEVEHPAAKLLVMASQQQEHEVSPPPFRA